MAPSKTRKRKSDQDIILEPAVEESVTVTSKRQRLPVRAKDGDSSPPNAKVSAKSNLTVFGDDDETHPPVVISSTKKTIEVATENDEESEDSDDDAPEAVSTQQAASQVKKSAQTAQKAAQEQAATQKRKRQEQDTLFKQQAEKRKQEEETKAKIIAESKQDDASDSDSPMKNTEPTSGRKRMNKTHVPNILPAEFLTDSSSEDEDEDTGSTKRPNNRGLSSIDRKLSRQDRAPRDARVGSTVYRVAKKSDERLAPRAKKYGQSSRDMLLKRNRSVATSGSGFFKR